MRAALAAIVLAGTTVVAGPTDSVAAQGQTFACDPGFYQVIEGQLAELDPASQAYATIGPDQSNVNAIEYRLADGFIYGMAGDSLERIDANGTRTSLATLPGAQGSYTGAFDDNGLLHASRGGRDWVTIDVDTFEVTPVPEFTSYTAVADITNVHGVFYGVSSSGSLYSYDQTSMQMALVGPVAGLPSTHSAYGAAWSTAGGNLYVGRNTGQIYQITGYTTATPQATQVGSAPATNSNDGASCSLAVPMAGLDDVDGPESESAPRTPEAEAAAQYYVDNYETISQGFVPAGEPEPEPEPTPTDDSTYTFDDAGLGTGPSCGPAVDVDRVERQPVTGVVSAGSPTVVYESSLGAGSLGEYRIVSGSWAEGAGSFDQLHTCGFDYTALLDGVMVSNFEWSATFFGTNGPNQGGITFHHSSPYTRSGAFVIDLTDGGETLRWGQYDTAGYFELLGSVAVTAPAAQQPVTLSATVHGGDVTISLDGTVVGSAQSVQTSGMVGLVASEAQISFDAVRLTVLPIPAAS